MFISTCDRQKAWEALNSFKKASAGSLEIQIDSFEVLLFAFNLQAKFDVSLMTLP